MRNAKICCGKAVRGKLEIYSLTPGLYYWFRVLELGAKGKSSYSDPAVIMAA